MESSHSVNGQTGQFFKKKKTVLMNFNSRTIILYFNKVKHIRKIQILISMREYNTKIKMKISKGVLSDFHENWFFKARMFLLN